jgi:hypothetical protein
MREVALPQAREIGRRLLELQGLYPKGSRGRYGTSSDFYPECKEQFGYSKSTVRRYIKIHDNWDWLMAYMVELPEGAQPITSVRTAVAAIEGRGRQLPPEAVDVKAETVAILPEPLTADRHASDFRKVFVKETGKLRATPIGRFCGEPLVKWIEEGLLLLDLMEEREVAMNLDDQLLQKAADAAEAQSPAAPPAPAPQPQPAATEKEPHSAEYQADLDRLEDLYPLTVEGKRELEEDMCSAGGYGLVLARKLGVSHGALIRHLQVRIPQALA